MKAEQRKIKTIVAILNTFNVAITELRAVQRPDITFNWISANL